MVRRLVTSLRSLEPGRFLNSHIDVRPVYEDIIIRTLMQHRPIMVGLSSSSTCEEHLLGPGTQEGNGETCSARSEIAEGLAMFSSSISYQV